MTHDRNGDRSDGRLIAADAGDGSEPLSGVPSDNTTLTSILRGLADEGFDAQFIVQSGGRVECVECGTVSAASDIPVATNRRLEGASDPADMMSVVAVSCPICEARGTVILGFGPAASDEDVDVARTLQEPGVRP